MEQHGEIILYQPDETVKLEVRLEDETVWLTQAQMSELFKREELSSPNTSIMCLRKMNLKKKVMCIFCTLQILTNLLNFTVWMLSYQLVIG